MVRVNCISNFGGIQKYEIQWPLISMYSYVLYKSIYLDLWGFLAVDHALASYYFTIDDVHTN